MYLMLEDNECERSKNQARLGRTKREQTMREPRVVKHEYIFHPRVPQIELCYVLDQPEIDDKYFRLCAK